jgi:lipopolysaccharide/colanic/teichoic acid biosynthesis glycosyltransferase
VSRQAPGTLALSVKRVVDVLLAGSALVLLSPLMLLIAVGIRITMGSPILFRHIRPGYHARLFTLIKFRTMRELPRGEDGQLLTLADVGFHLGDRDRVTRLGNFLRRTSLDELPELWNILRGEMSIVGPRPLLIEYLSLYSPDQARRHDVKPGLTGLAQTKGRRALPMPERLRLDTWYVDHWSLALDTRLMGRTVRMVLSGAGVEPAAYVDIHDLGWERKSANDTTDSVPAAMGS